MYQNSYNYYPQAQSIQAQYPNQYSRYAQVPSGLKGRPVSSLEEVRATGIDFDGSIFYFPDIANKRIYTKQINLDGTASLNMYELKDIPSFPSAEVNISYVSKDEFEKVVNTLLSEINLLKGTTKDEQQQSIQPTLDLKF